MARLQLIPLIQIQLIQQVMGYRLILIMRYHQRLLSIQMLMLRQPLQRARILRLQMARYLPPILNTQQVMGYRLMVAMRYQQT